MSNRLVPLNLPKAPLKLAKRSGTPVVWDSIRGKYLKLTPEEWVRQHFVNYLLLQGYKKQCIAMEGGFRQNDNLQRTDILIYKNGNPVLIVECKAPQIKIGQPTFDQAARYNRYYNTGYLAVTNGLQHYCVKTDHAEKKYYFLNEIPDFDEL